MADEFPTVIVQPDIPPPEQVEPTDNYTLQQIEDGLVRPNDAYIRRMARELRSLHGVKNPDLA